MQVRVGLLNEAELRQKTLDLMSRVNPGMPTASEIVPLFFTEFDFTLGAQYTGARGKLKYALGVGYSLMGNMFTGEEDGGPFGLSSSTDDLELYSGFSLWRHGPVIKALGYW